MLASNLSHRDRKPKYLSKFWTKHGGDGKRWPLTPFPFLAPWPSRPPASETPPRPVPAGPLISWPKNVSCSRIRDDERFWYGDLRQSKMGEGSRSESHSTGKKCRAIFCGSDFFSFLSFSGLIRCPGIGEWFCENVWSATGSEMVRVNWTAWLQFQNSCEIWFTCLDPGFG